MEENSSDTYGVSQMSRILGIETRRAQQLAEDLAKTGEAAKKDGRWRIQQQAVHRLLQERGSPRGARESPPESSETLREWAERVNNLERELGRLEGRLELTAQTESTIREERDRLLNEVSRERDRADRLEEELRQSRRSWWKRLFGG